MCFLLWGAIEFDETIAIVFGIIVDFPDVNVIVGYEWTSRWMMAKLGL